jgi:hypothetical protein
MGHTGDSLPGVDSYSWYTPCFLPIGSNKVRPQDVLIQFYDILWAIWVTPCQELTPTLGITSCFLPIGSFKVSPQDVLIQFYDILWAIRVTPCQELTPTLGILLVFSLLEVLRSGLRMYIDPR